MSPQALLSSHSREMPRFRSFRGPFSKAVGIPLALAAALIGGVSASAQTTQQQYVYGSVSTTTTTSEVAAFSKDGQTGALASQSSSPVPDKLEGGSMAVDALGRFLFVINSTTSKISVFHIDPASGSLTEVAASPFSTGATENPNMAPSSPSCLATEASGQFLYVGYRFGNLPGKGAINEYLIDAANQQLLPLTVQQTTDIDSAPIGMVTGLKSRYLYVGLGLNPVTGIQDAGTNVYSIDTVTGQLLSMGAAGNAAEGGLSIAIDPHSRFFFAGWGLSQGFIDAALISPQDGTATTGVTTTSLASSGGGLPFAMLAESGGKFLYVQQGADLAIYSLDQATGALTQTQPPASLLSFRSGTAVADPIGPYIYALETSGVHGFQIDPQSGALSEIPGSPFSGASGGARGLAISGAPVQAVSGPVAALFPSSQAFGTVTVGQTSNSRIISLTNTGDQALIVNSVSVVGANAGDFAATANCPTVLQANASCSASVAFTPAAAGPRQASLTASDNAPGSPQPVPLSGTGVAPQPAVTLVPGSISFPSTLQGSASPTQMATITNSGTTVLHISTILLSGANPSDFNIATSNCNGAFAVNAGCSITLTFAPLGNGLRTASIVIADDAPGSPQSVQLSGTGTGTPMPRSGVTLAPAVLSFGTITQGVTSPLQNITLTSSGTSALHISSIVLGGTNPADFSMTNGCGAPAYAVGATCTVGLTFTPLAAGPRSAALTISDDAPNSPQTILISGNASPNPNPSPVLTVTGGVSAVVKAGQTATYNLQLTPSFSGSISFPCTGVPLGAACSVPSLQVTSSTPASLTVTVTTSGAGSLVPVQSARRHPPFADVRVLPLITRALLLLACAICMVLVSTVSGKRLIQSTVFAASALVVMLQVGGCGGGGVTAQSVPITQPLVTPQGTSTILVTPLPSPTNGKSLGAVPPIQLTLTVQ